MLMKDVKRGQLVWVHLGDGTGSEQQGIRPFLILQNNVGNLHAPTTIGAPLTTSRPTKACLPTHVSIKREDILLVEGSLVEGLSLRSDILLEQVRTISKSRISQNGLIGTLSHQHMKRVDQALLVSLGLSEHAKEA